MARLFLTTKPDGGVAITRIHDPVGDILAKTMFELSRDGSDMETHFDPTIHTLDAIAAGIPGHRPLTCREYDESGLPAEQALRGIEPTFRDAWEDTGTAVQVNMPKARLIHMERIRQARNAAIEALDVAYMKALEAGDTIGQDRIATEKQILRDIPQTFSLSSYRSPATLKAAWPAPLPTP